MQHHFNATSTPLSTDVQASLFSISSMSFCCSLRRHCPLLSLSISLPLSPSLDVFSYSSPLQIQTPPASPASYLRRHNDVSTVLSFPSLRFNDFGEALASPRFTTAVVVVVVVVAAVVLAGRLGGVSGLGSGGGVGILGRLLRLVAGCGLRFC